MVGVVMGLTRRFSDSCICSPTTAPAVPDGNPNKYRFTVNQTRRVGKAIVAMVHYPDCINFEGLKILVYENAEEFESLHRNKVMDPHFLDGQASPIARFEPTDRGWKLAIKFAKLLDKGP